MRHRSHENIRRRGWAGKGQPQRPAARPGPPCRVPRGSIVGGQNTHDKTPASVEAPEADETSPTRMMSAATTGCTNWCQALFMENLPRARFERTRAPQDPGIWGPGHSAANLAEIALPPLPHTAHTTHHSPPAIWNGCEMCARPPLRATPTCAMSARWSTAGVRAGGGGSITSCGILSTPRLDERSFPETC